MRIYNLLLAISMCLASLAKAEIIQRGADGTEYGATEQAQQLWEAVKANDVQTVQQLVTEKNVASFLNRGGEWLHRSRITEKSTLLHVAASNNNRDVVEFLIRNGAHVDVQDERERTPLHLAAKNNSSAAAELLIEEGAQIDAQDHMQRTPLHIATRKNNRGVAELLIKRGASLDARDHWQQTPLHIATRENNRGVAEPLIEKGASVDARGNSQRTPLHIAAWWNNREVAELLIEKCASVDARDYLQQTPLHIAAVSKSLDVAELLIERGASLDARDNSQRTPLHIAAWMNRRGVAELLIERGASLDARDHRQQTPLHIAVRKNNQGVAELLIEKGASVDAQDYWKQTPLHIAAAWGSREIAELLIAAGARVDLLDSDGHSPASAAQGEVLTLIQAVFIRSEDGHIFLPEDERIPAQTLRSADEKAKVGYVIMFAHQGRSNNVQRILYFLERDESRAEAALQVLMLLQREAFLGARYGERADKLSEVLDELVTNDENVQRLLPHVAAKCIRNNTISRSLLKRLCSQYKELMASYRDIYGKTLLHYMAEHGITAGCQDLFEGIVGSYANRDMEKRLRNANRETPRDIARKHRDAMSGHAHRYQRFIDVYDMLKASHTMRKTCAFADIDIVCHYAK